MHSESHTDLSIALLAGIFQCSGSQWCKTGGLVWTGQHWICSTYFSPQAPVCRPRFEHLRKCCLLSMDGTEIKKEFSRGRFGCGWGIPNFPRKDFSDKSTAISARPTLTLFVLKLTTIFEALFQVNKTALVNLPERISWPERLGNAGSGSCLSPRLLRWATVNQIQKLLKLQSIKCLVLDQVDLSTERLSPLLFPSFGRCVIKGLLL